MNGNLKNYLESIAENLPAEIVSIETYAQIERLGSFFQDFAASEYIMETDLNAEEAEADFSFRVLSSEQESFLKGLKNSAFSTLAQDATWRRIINFADFWPPEIEEIWLEMDYDEAKQSIPKPCFFFQARQIKKGLHVDEKMLFEALQYLVDPEQLLLLWLSLREVIDQIPPDVGLFQVGVMLARKSDRVRIFTNELTWQQTLEYLEAIGWAGSFTKLGELFQRVHPYSDGQYILDFDVSSEGISEKIGINFGLKTQKELPDFLQHLIDHELCCEGKKTGVQAWSGSKGIFLGKDYGQTALIQNISHFKIAYFPEGGFKAKAYLKFVGVYMKDLFTAKAFSMMQGKRAKPEDGKPSYRERQELFKAIAQKSILDPEYRELCLRDSQAAIQRLAPFDARILDPMVFLEEDQGEFDPDEIAYILPPLLESSWLTSK